MSQIFAIERGVPVPPRSSGSSAPSPYPIANLSVGDSFFVPFGAILGKDGKPISLISLASRIQAASSGIARRHKDRKFVVRKLPADNGVRCWRLL